MRKHLLGVVFALASIVLVFVVLTARSTEAASSECSTNSDCGGDGQCPSGKCGSCSTNKDCTGGTCASGHCSNSTVR